MYECSIDINRNRMYITLKGRPTAEEAKQAADEVIEMTNQLKSGFDVVTDISEFEPVTKKETELLKHVHHVLAERGVNRIARIVGKELKATVGKIQFERTSRQTNVIAEHFDSVETADRYLNG